MRIVKRWCQPKFHIITYPSNLNLLMRSFTKIMFVIQNAILNLKHLKQNNGDIDIATCMSMCNCIESRCRRKSIFSINTTQLAKTLLNMTHFGAEYFHLFSKENNA